MKKVIRVQDKHNTNKEWVIIREGRKYEYNQEICGLLVNDKNQPTTKAFIEDMLNVDLTKLFRKAVTVQDLENTIQTMLDNFDEMEEVAAEHGDHSNAYAALDEIDTALDNEVTRIALILGEELSHQSPLFNHCDYIHSELKQR